jgi:heavy metal sensor kinase
MRLAPVSVRARLTLWHAVLMALVLAVFALGIYAYVRESLFAQIDSRLEEHLAVVAATARTDPDELVEVERHSSTIIFRVIENDWPLYASGGWAAGNLDTAYTSPNIGRIIFTSDNGGIYHLKDQRLVIGDRQLHISAAEQAEQIHRSIRKLALTLLGGFPVTLLVSLLGGYFLAGRALSPVQHLTYRARAISAENLSERLAVPNPQDEIGQLTTVLNDAFVRLEDSFTRLRRFSHDVAHELRTPLAVIRSVGEVGLQQQRDPKAYRDIIGSMLEEVDRLGHLVDNLLTLARAESGRFSANLRLEDLHDLCQDVTECLQVLAEEKRQNLTFTSKGSHCVLIDCDTLRLALINILANAIRYTQVNGHIHVRLESDATGASMIEIGDNGPGIAKEHHAHLFERFYRVDRSRSHETGGAGLGLAIARWAVESNGGSIELESEPGQGCVFRLRLPLVNPVSAPPGA